VPVFVPSKLFGNLISSDIFPRTFVYSTQTIGVIEGLCCWRNAVLDNLPTDLHNFKHLNITTRSSIQQDQPKAKNSNDVISSIPRTNLRPRYTSLKTLILNFRIGFQAGPEERPARRFSVADSQDLARVPRTRKSL
jgi:hypothetical protein